MRPLLVRFAVILAVTLVGQHRTAAVTPARAMVVDYDRCLVVQGREASARLRSAVNAPLLWREVMLAWTIVRSREVGSSTSRRRRLTPGAASAAGCCGVASGAFCRTMPGTIFWGGGGSPQAVAPAGTTVALRWPRSAM